MRRLRHFGDGNAKLRRLFADLALDKALLQVVVSRNLFGLIGGGSSSPLFAARGRSAYGGHAGCFGRSERATIIVEATPITPT